MKFIRKMTTKMVSDIGAIILLRPWKVSRTSPSTKPTMISTMLWNLPGTPEVARRAQRMNTTTNRIDSTAVKNRVSTFKVMNVLSPTLTCRWCRWWLMYSVEPPLAGSVAIVLSGINAAAPCAGSKPGGRRACRPPAPPGVATEAAGTGPAPPPPPRLPPTTCPARPAAAARMPRPLAASRHPAPPPVPARWPGASRCPPPPPPVPGADRRPGTPRRRTARRRPGRLPRAMLRGDPWQWDRARDSFFCVGRSGAGSRVKTAPLSRRIIAAGDFQRQPPQGRRRVNGRPGSRNLRGRAGSIPARPASFLVSRRRSTKPRSQSGASPFPGDVQVGDRALVDLGAQPHRFTEGRMRVDGVADVGRLGAHLDGQGDLGDELAGVDPDDAATHDPVAFGVEQQLGGALGAAQADGAAGGGPGEPGHLDGHALGLCLGLGHPDPGDLGIGVGHRRDHPRHPFAL